MSLRVYLILIVSCLIIPVYGQTVKSVERDTLPNFADKFPKWDFFNKDGERMVEFEGKVLYLKIYDSTRTYIQFEYFLVNDSTYFRYEYRPNGGYRSFGQIVVRDEIVKVDSTWLEDPNNPGTFVLRIDILTQVLRTGIWTEYSSICKSFSDVWVGEYEGDTRVGTWKHWISARSGLKYLTETIDYSVVPAKKTFENNVCMNLPKDSLKMKLTSGWTNISEDRCSLMELFVCHRNTDQVFDGYCVYWYFDLHKNGSADINDHESSKGIPAKWTLEGGPGQYFIRTKVNKGEVSTYDIVYLDVSGHMLLRKR